MKNDIAKEMLYRQKTVGIATGAKRFVSYRNNFYEIKIVRKDSDESNQLRKDGWTYFPGENKKEVSLEKTIEKNNIPIKRKRGRPRREEVLD